MFICWIKDNEYVPIHLRSKDIVEKDNGTKDNQHMIQLQSTNNAFPWFTSPTSDG